jgi:lysozyme
LAGRHRLEQGSRRRLWFILNVPNDPDALPPVLDLEWNGHSRGCPKRIPAKLALEKIKIMLDVMEAHTGKRPIIYTDVTFHREVLAGELPGYNFWLRSVAAEPQEIYRDRPWLFWQFTTTGYVPGIEKPVDRNVFNGTFGDWRQVLPARAPDKQSVRNAN